MASFFKAKCDKLTTPPLPPTASPSQAKEERPVARPRIVPQREFAVLPSLTYHYPITRRGSDTSTFSTDSADSAASTASADSTTSTSSTPTDPPPRYKSHFESETGFVRWTDQDDYQMFLPPRSRPEAFAREQRLPL